MTAQQLLHQLERIIADHGPGIIVEARNVAGDMNPLDWETSVQVGVGWGGVTTVWLDPSAE